MLTPEQLAELERRGWSVTGLYKGTGTTARWGTAVIQEWAKKQTDGRLLVGNDRVWWEGDLQMAAEIAAVLGITPSGYRLVPDSAAREAAWLLCKMAEADMPTHWDRTRAPEVAAALRGETTESMEVVVPSSLMLEEENRRLRDTLNGLLEAVLDLLTAEWDDNDTSDAWNKLTEIVRDMGYDWDERARRWRLLE